MRAVARQFKVSDQSVNVWCQTFHWHSRITDREKKIAAAVQGRGDVEAIKIRSDQINIGRAVIAKFAARLGGPDIRMQHDVSKYEPNAMDAARWAQHLLLLTGQATSRSEHVMGADTVDALARGVVSILRKHLTPELQEKISSEIIEYAHNLTVKAVAGSSVVQNAGAGQEGHA